MIIDARGKACPIPVIMTKKQLEAGNEQVTVTVDNDIAVENLKKLAQSMGRVVNSKKEGKDFYVDIGEGFSENIKIQEDKNCGNYAVFIGKNYMGDGDFELGSNLIKMAIYTISESEDIPKYVLFMNSGVKLVAGEENQIVQNVKDLIKKGTEVLVCGTCLNYYNIADKLQVGEVSNMYDIMSAMQNSNKVISL